MVINFPRNSDSNLVAQLLVEDSQDLINAHSRAAPRANVPGNVFLPLHFVSSQARQLVTISVSKKVTLVALGKPSPSSAVHVKLRPVITAHPLRYSHTPWSSIDFNYLIRRSAYLAYKCCNVCRGSP
jgi:hypothetical protein